MPRYIVHIETPVDADSTDIELDPAASVAEGNRQFVASLGLDLVEFYYTTGRYHAVAILEAPDDETAIAAAGRARDAGADLELATAISHEAIEA